MQGCEVMWTDVAALMYDLQYCERLEDESTISWPIAGWSKGNDVHLTCHMITIKGKMKSGIHFFKWTQSFVEKLFQKDIKMDVHSKDETKWEQSPQTSETASLRSWSSFKALQIWSILISMCGQNAEYGQEENSSPPIAIINKFLSTRENFSADCRLWAKGQKTVNQSVIHTYSEVKNINKVLCIHKYAEHTKFWYP